MKASLLRSVVRGMYESPMLARLRRVHFERQVEKESLRTKSVVQAVGFNLLSREALATLPGHEKQTLFILGSAQGFVKALESEAGLGEVFNMGSGFEISMGDVVDMIRTMSSQSFDVVEDAERVRPNTSEVERLWSDSTRMKNTFDWSPAHAHKEGLLQGLEKTYEWFSHYFNGPGYQTSSYVV